eukprot:SAG31_NODE_24438_length_481_cov_0.934555_1_plen_147_part_01
MGKAAVPTDGTAEAHADVAQVPNWVDSIAHMFAGWLSGVVSMAMIYPVDTIKTRLQVHGVALPKYHSMPQFLMAMYAGMPVGLLETGAVHGSSFLFYEFLKGIWTRSQLGRPLKPGEKGPMPGRTTSMVMGMVSALMTMQCTLPLKV